jgi:hypothetical protein
MRRFLSITLLVVSLVAAPALFAQFETSEVLGTVRDLSNAVLPSAIVTLTNQQTGVAAKTTTNENGEYNFFDVQVGVYTVRVEHGGFFVATAADIRVTVNLRQRVDMVMQVGEVSNTVNVTAAASTLTTDSSEHSQVIGTEPTVELPLNGRDPTDLALLAYQYREIAHLHFVLANRHAALGDSEQALQYFAGGVEANPQNIYNLAAERGPSNFDVKLNNVNSVVYELPFGKGKQFASSANPVLDQIIGGWELRH